MIELICRNKYRLQIPTFEFGHPLYVLLRRGKTYLRISSECPLYYFCSQRLLKKREFRTQISFLMSIAKSLQRYSEHWQTSKTEISEKIVKPVTYFRKNVHLRCLTGFWRRFRTNSGVALVLSWSLTGVTDKSFWYLYC